MGLDMYLEARRYISPTDMASESMRRKVGALIGYKPGTDKPGGIRHLLEVCAVVICVGYWRKHRALHRWFVNKVQNGDDDCRSAYVSVALLEALKDDLNQVKNATDRALKHFSGDHDELWQLSLENVDFTLQVIEKAQELHAEGWDLYYSSSW